LPNSIRQIKAFFLAANLTESKVLFLFFISNGNQGHYFHGGTIGLTKMPNPNIDIMVGIVGKDKENSSLVSRRSYIVFRLDSATK